jgi:hypothetical protein
MWGGEKWEAHGSSSGRRNHVTFCACPEVGIKADPRLSLARPPCKRNPAPALGGDGIRFETGLEPVPYAFVHLLMFHTGPSLVGFSRSPFNAVR